MLIFFFTKTQNCSICTDFAEGLSSQRGSDSTTHLSCPAEIRYSDSYRTVLKQLAQLSPQEIRQELHQSKQWQSQPALTIQTNPL